jgi:hypothetical protein
MIRTVIVSHRLSEWAATGQIVKHVALVAVYVALDLLALFQPEAISHHLAARLRFALAPGRLDDEENALDLLGELLELEAGVVSFDSGQPDVHRARRLHRPGVGFGEELTRDAG